MVTYENEAFQGPGPVKPVPGVVLDAPGSPHVTATSDSAGHYSLSGFGPGPYTVTASRAGYPIPHDFADHGIFSNDASLVARHVVHLTTLSPTQIRAGTVNGLNLPISSFDAALIAQWIVNVPNVNNRTGQWIMTPTTTMPNVAINNTQNYTALLLGDVDASWTPSMMGPIEAPLTDLEKITDAVHVSLASVKAAKGTEVVIPLRLDNLRGGEVTSYQFSVQYDPEVVQPAEIAAEIAGTMDSSFALVYNSTNLGLLNIAVYGTMPVTGDGVYLNLRFSVLGGAGSTTPLSIQHLHLNDGSSDVFVTDGRVSVKRLGTSVLTGRVSTSDGPAAHTLVLLSGADGVRASAIANEEGRFEFSELAVGQTYTVTVVSRSLTFTQRVISIKNSVMELDLIAEQY